MIDDERSNRAFIRVYFASGEKAKNHKCSECFHYKSLSFIAKTGEQSMVCTGVSRKVVGKTVRDNTERIYG